MTRFLAITLLLWLLLSSGACLDVTFVRGEGALCDALTPCATGFFCDGDLTCQPLRPLAVACDRDAACESTHCSGGICCATACLGTCTTCSQQGNLGQCVPVEANLDPRDQCPGTTRCSDGARCQATPRWWLELGFVGDQQITTIVPAADGVVIAGEFDQQLVLGGQAIQSGDAGSDRDAFVAAVRPASSEATLTPEAVAWVFLLQGAGDQRVTGVAVEGDDTYVVGHHLGDDPAGGSPSIGHDGDVVALDATGEVRFWRRIDGDGEQKVIDLAVHEGGLFVLVALEGETAGVDGCLQSSPAAVGVPSAAILRFDAETGLCTASRRLEVQNVPIVPHAMTIGEAGLFLALTRRDDMAATLQLQRFSPDALGSPPTFVFNLFEPAASDGGDDTVVELVATGDALWVAGHYQDRLLLDEPYIAAGERDLFLARFDAALTVTRAAVWGTPYDEELTAFALDPSGRPVIAGAFEAELDLGDGGIVSAGGRDGFLAQLDADGDPIWSVPFGGVQDDAITALAVPNDLVVGASFVYDTSLFGRTPNLTAVDPRDAAVVGLTP